MAGPGPATPLATMTNRPALLSTLDFFAAHMTGRVRPGRACRGPACLAGSAASHCRVAPGLPRWRAAPARDEQQHPPGFFDLSKGGTAPIAFEA